MSYFDDASLVMIPSGYKTSKVYSVKPTDGTGDLTFTRSNDTATRVAPNGYIEKVRTNVLLQSNTFSTTWTNTNTSETGGQSGYDGSSAAWLLEKSAASGKISQTISTSALVTFSIYAKANTLNWIAILFDGVSGGQAYFDLQNGIVGSRGAGVLNHTITAVGGGWYRITTTTSSALSGISIFPADANNNVSGTSGNIYIQDAQLEVGDIATDYIATTSAAVSVGPVANVPRLDYLGSSCPRLLLEGQRTNLVTYDSYYGTYTINNATLASNVVTSPDGYQDASSITQTNTTAGSISFPAISYTSGTTYTHSIFVKQGTKDFIFFTEFASSSVGGARSSWFSFATKTWTTLNGAHTGSYVDYGNGWLRLTITFTAGITLGRVHAWGHADTTNSTTVVASGVTYFYGAQAEVGSYMTSLIPTNGASVTRGGENASKTGLQAAGVFGATAGSVVLDFQGYSEDSNQIVWQIADASATPIFRIYYKQEGLCSVFQIYNTINGEFVTANFTLTTNPKIAIVWDGTSRLEVFGNGAKITRTGGLLSSNAVADQITKISTSTDVMNIKQMLIFPTALTDAQAIELTTL